MRAALARAGVLLPALAPLQTTLVSIDLQQLLPPMLMRGAKAKAAPKKASKAGAKGKKGAGAPPKQQKQRMESRPFNDKDPLMQKVLALLAPPNSFVDAAEVAARRSPEEAAEVMARQKEYSRRKMAEHRAWLADMSTKLKLKRAALSALPPSLRAAAAAEDLTPFPLTRHFLYDTPPESYRD